MQLHLNAVPNEDLFRCKLAEMKSFLLFSKPKLSLIIGTIHLETCFFAFFFNVQKSLFGLVSQSSSSYANVV